MGSNKRSLEAKLHTTQMVSTQNIEKTKCVVFLKDRERERDYRHFKIKQKVCPNSLPNFTDSKRSDYLDYVFSKDIVWVLVSAIGNKYVSSDKDSLEPIRSWTTFMKSISSVKTHKAILEYLEVAPLPPGVSCVFQTCDD